MGHGEHRGEAELPDAVGARSPGSRVGRDPGVGALQEPGALGPAVAEVAERGPGFTRSPAQARGATRPDVAHALPHRAVGAVAVAAEFGDVLSRGRGRGRRGAPMGCRPDRRGRIGIVPAHGQEPARVDEHRVPLDHDPHGPRDHPHGPGGSRRGQGRPHQNAAPTRQRRGLGLGGVRPRDALQAQRIAQRIRAPETDRQLEGLEPPARPRTYDPGHPEGVMTRGEAGLVRTPHREGHPLGDGSLGEHHRRGVGGFARSPQRIEALGQTPPGLGGEPLHDLRGRLQRVAHRKGIQRQVGVATARNQQSPHNRRRPKRSRWKPQWCTLCATEYPRTSEDPNALSLRTRWPREQGPHPPRTSCVTTLGASGKEPFPQCSHVSSFRCLESPRWPWAAWCMAQRGLWPRFHRRITP